MLIRIWLFGLTLTVVSCDLSGENICETEERYPLNVTEFYMKNVTVRNYKWCMGFPPRCSFYTLKEMKVPHVVIRTQIKHVRKCCPGFSLNSRRDACVQCKKCYEGTCGKDGKCLCNPGFRGDDCADVCQPMRWGLNCQQECLCEHGVCNPRTGSCDCPTGWFGTRCEVPCLEGFYGKDCNYRCSCGERDLCSPETGECLTKPPRQQEHQSTRAIHYMTDDIVNLTLSLNKHRSTPSLKKYYAFDLELNNNSETEGREVHIDENVIPKVNRKDSWPSTTVSTKIKHKNHYGGLINSAEDSAESTTEMSAEIDRKIENVAIIGEDGSLEQNGRVSSEEQSQEIIDEKFESKEKYSLQKTKVKKENKTGHNKEELQTHISEESPNEIEVSHNKHQKSTDDSNYRNQKMLKSGPFNTMLSVNTHNSQVNKGYHSPKKNESISSEALDSITKLTETTSRVYDFSTSNIDIIEEIIPPTTFKPHPKTTSAKNIKMKNITKVIEENELQDLNIINNILTSIETTTQYNPTTVESINFAKKGILPIDDVIPSTKSIEIRNDLHNAESTENQILMKGAYERRNSHEENGEGASEEFDYSTNKNNVTTHMAIVGLVSFILVLILSGIILVHHFTRKMRKKTTSIKIDNQNYGGSHSVSVYTHSIFHTPLPDPPTFDNPVFKAPSEVTADHRTIQTHVICSLNFPENKANDEKEYTYDHPPSTGSYRAASIPEPHVPRKMCRCPS